MGLLFHEHAHLERWGSPMSSEMTRGRNRAFRAGVLSGMILFCVGVVQAVVVALDQLHGAFGTVVAVLFWPGFVLAMVPLVLLGQNLGDGGIRGWAALRAGALAGFVAGLGYLIADVLILLAMRQRPLSSNPAVVPSFTLAPFVALLVVASLAGALLSLVGARVARSRRREPITVG